MDHTLRAKPGHINFSPIGFLRVTRDLLKCAESFKRNTFSLIPYFLYSRAIELSLKPLHLESSMQHQVKKTFKHNLVKSDDALPREAKILSASQHALLRQLNNLYMKKAFEYMQPEDAATGFSKFPNLVKIAELARRLCPYQWQNGRLTIGEKHTL